MNIVEENTVNLGPHSQYPKSVKAGIPKLSDSKPGWKKLPISELFDVVTRPVDMKDETVYNLVTVKRSRGGITEREKLPGSKISVKSQFYVEGGDFLISKRQIVHGACGFVPEELSGSIVSNEYSVLHCKEIIQPEFLNYLIHTPYFQQTCFHSSIGIHVEKMIFKLDDWFKWKIYIPSESEQKKIALFLGAVDNKLNNLRCKHELLETYKRGLMQKLFSQEIRFKQDDGSDYPNWVTSSLEQLSTITMGSSPNSSAYNELNEGLPLIQGNADIKDRKTSPRVYTTEITKECFPLDLLLSVRAPVGEISIASHHACIGRGVASIRAKKDTNQDYLFQFLLSYEPRWKSVSQGSTFESINSKEITNLSIPTPSIDEQIKIAGVLTEFDKKISAVSDKINKIETFKKGLLQKVFA